jgi:hypothetical protein
MTEPEVRAFLLNRIKDGFTFPLNPKWVVCDRGWDQVWNALCTADGGKGIEPWFPQSSGLRKRIDALRTMYPEGYPTQERHVPGEGTGALLLEKTTAIQDFYKNQMLIASLKTRHRLSQLFSRLSFSKLSKNRVTSTYADVRRRIALRAFNFSSTWHGFNVSPCHVEVVEGATGAGQLSDVSVQVSEELAESTMHTGADGPLRLEPNVFQVTLKQVAGQLPVRVAGPESLLASFEAIGIARADIVMHVSPFHKVNLPMPERKAAQIPYAATFFAFMYPVEKALQLSEPSANETREQKLHRLQAFTIPKVDLLLNGGYVYVDNTGGIHGINALRSHTIGELTETTHEEYSFNLDGPYPLSETARRRLKDHGRFRLVTDPALRTMGAESFAWVTPDESFKQKTALRAAARRASRTLHMPEKVKVVAEATIEIGPVANTFGAFAYANRRDGGGPSCYFRLVPNGVPHAQLTISSDMCTRRFVPIDLAPPLNCTVAEIKECIATSTSIAVEVQQLLKAGTPLDDNDATMEQCGIQSGNALTLHLLIVPAKSKEKEKEKPGARSATSKTSTAEAEPNKGSPPKRGNRRGSFFSGSAPSAATEAAHEVESAVEQVVHELDDAKETLRAGIQKVVSVSRLSR